jgi:hypothetical protein
MKIRLIRRLATAALAVAATTGTVVATAGAASADSTYTISYGSTPYWIAASTDSMPVSVSQASYTPGASVIQWYNTGGDEQKWYFDGVYDQNGNRVGFMLRNKRTGQCLDTSGWAGYTLYQSPCALSTYGEIWNNFPNYNIYGNQISWRYQNRDSGLWLDVNGGSISAGASIDTWYQNYGFNQDFFLTQAP